MKIVLGNYMIETNHIETIKKRRNICEIQFTSGYSLAVYCSTKASKLKPATFDGNPKEFLEFIDGIDKLQND